MVCLKVQNLQNMQNVESLVSQIDIAMNLLENVYGVKSSQVNEILLRRKQMKGVPLSIFNEKLGALESIVKYMKENLMLNYSTISKLLKRNQGPIGVTYRRSKQKVSVCLDDTSDEFIPFEVFTNSKYSVLENIVMHLVLRGYSVNEVAIILCRNKQTIWTIVRRARAK